LERQRDGVSAAEQSLRAAEQGRRRLGFGATLVAADGRKDGGSGPFCRAAATLACVPGLEGRRDLRRGSRAGVAGGGRWTWRAGPGVRGGLTSGARLQAVRAGERWACVGAGRWQAEGVWAARGSREEWGGELGRPGERGRERWRRTGLGSGVGRGERVGLGSGLLGFGSWVTFPISFLFSISTPNKVLNSKQNLNSNHTQIKVCTSMNATTKI